MKRLLIDDMRTYEVERIARTYADGIAALQSEHWDELYLDHDLACFDESGREFTGYHVVCWLEENPDHVPGKIIIVSSNPVGRQRMEQVIRRLYGGY